MWFKNSLYLLKGIYLAAIVFFSLLVLVALVGLQRGRSEMLEASAIFWLMLCYSGVIFYGLLRQKAWTLDLILYLSAVWFAQALIFAPESISVAIFKFFGVGFAAYQIWFFTTPEVAHFFHKDGKTFY